METKGFSSVSQIRGAMSQQRVAAPAAFERANYIKILESWEAVDSGRTSPTGRGAQEPSRFRSTCHNAGPGGPPTTSATKMLTSSCVNDDVPVCAARPARRWSTSPVWLPS